MSEVLAAGRIQKAWRRQRWLQLVAAKTQDEEGCLAPLARALSQGRALLRRNKHQDAVRLLERALLDEIPQEQRDELKARMEARQDRRSSVAELRRNSDAAATAVGATMPTGRRMPAVELPVELPLCPIGDSAVDWSCSADSTVALVLKAMCLGYTKLRQWQVVCDTAALALDLEVCPLTDELRTELLLRRGISWLHLASLSEPNSGGNTTVPRIEELLRAESDLHDVLKYSPKEPLAIRGARDVAFLKRQVLQQCSGEERALHGLARLRAMDP